MKIFNTSQIREIDAYSIAHEPISSIDLMERAATACTSWISSRFKAPKPLVFFCGTGNNGGDGLAVARLLAEKNYPVKVHLIKTGKTTSPDCQTNLDRLPAGLLQLGLWPENIPVINPDTLVIDALFGTGLKRPPEGPAANVIHLINQSGATILSIDLPSGMFADGISDPHTTVHASHTLSFEFFKLAFLMPGIGELAGEVNILPIRLDREAVARTPTPYQVTDSELIASIHKSRNPFSHKGNYGHDLIIAGSYGKMGAAVFAARACLRSGAGLVTSLVPQQGYEIIQVSIPEAMCLVDAGTTSPEQLIPDLEQYSAIAIGPGLGTGERAFKLLRYVLKTHLRPMVIDADALNLISLHQGLLNNIPPGSILTPHLKEFERLFGKTGDAFERLDLLLKKSKEHRVHILLKGRYTQIACPDGRCYFNPTGNPGMATGGTGDTLTGIITGLLGQGYSPEHATIFGAYLHGLAGDLAAAQFSQEGMLASDLIENLGSAFKFLKN